MVKSRASSLRGAKRAAMVRIERFPGVNDELQQILDADMEEVGPRRRAREAFKSIQLSIDHILFKVLAICVCVVCRFEKVHAFVFKDSIFDPFF